MDTHSFATKLPRLDRRQALTSVFRTVTTLLGGAILALLLLSHRSWPIERLTLAGMFFVCLSTIILTRFHLSHTPLGRVSPAAAERMVWLIALLSIGGTQLLTRSLGPQNLVGTGFLMTAPLVAQAMLVSALLSPPIALFALTIVCFMLGVSRALPVETLAAAWLAGAVGSHAVNPLKQRSDLLRAVTIQALAQGILALCISAATTDKPGVVMESAGWGAVAAVVGTSIFWLAVAVLEKLFGITSDWSLLELCSPDHPLIRELCLYAPGTYAHSVMVGNLAEQAAREIGANPVICRAMAYYHDVGKLKRPAYFIENQMGDNPHDAIPPDLSARVVRQHVEDGMEYAKKYGLPQIVRNGIVQHHGTSLIAYFYQRSLQADGRDPQDLEYESQFRYAGPKPQTRESAILMLADTVEAACRTVRGSSEDLEIAVNKLIEEKRADGQLDECDLTFRDLVLIRDAFLRSLGAIRHERIAYPDIDHATSATPSHLDLKQLGQTPSHRPDSRRHD